MQDLLFRMVDRPIFERPTRVRLRLATGGGAARAKGDGAADARWPDGRRRIVDAIAASDEPLARFEADRSNRQPLLARMGAAGIGTRQGPREGNRGHETRVGGGD